MVFFLVVALLPEAYGPTTPYTVLWTDLIRIRNIAVSGNGQYVAAVAGSGFGNKLRFYDRNSGTPLWEWSTGDLGEQLYSVVVSQDGEYVAAIGYHRVYFWAGASSLTGTNPVTNPTWSSVAFGFTEQRCLAISDDGNYLAAGGENSYVGYWKNTIGIPPGTSNVQTTWDYDLGSAVYAIDLSSDGNYVVAGTASHSVAYWKNAKEIAGHAPSGPQPDWLSTQINPALNVVDVAVSDNGDYVVAVSHSITGTLHYWAGAKQLSGDPAAKWHNELWAGPIFDAVDMSSDGDKVIAGASTGVYFWSYAASLDDVPTPPTPSWVYATLLPVMDVAINRAGEYMAAATQFATYFFNFLGSSLWTPPYNLDSFTSISISNDGGTLAVGTAGSTAHLLNTGFSTLEGAQVFPVGGFIEPEHKPDPLMPYVLIVGLVCLTTIIFVKKRHRIFHTFSR